VVRVTQNADLTCRGSGVTLIPVPRQQPGDLAFLVKLARSMQDV
jgi:hypothetical protein